MDRTRTERVALEIILPVSVKLDGEVRHDAHSFVSEGHLHLDDPGTASERARYLQTLRFHGWEPNLNRIQIRFDQF